jgi:hypothetical protein
MTPTYATYANTSHHIPTYATHANLPTYASITATSTNATTINTTPSNINFLDDAIININAQILINASQTNSAYTNKSNE